MPAFGEGHAQTNRFSGVDIVVNNAGVSSAGMIGELGYDTLRWTMDVNFWGRNRGVPASPADPPRSPPRQRLERLWLDRRACSGRLLRQ
jgi:NAD(P)-dependent dehydrogenase (short-subunit alcohol dehydrogenase family)